MAAFSYSTTTPATRGNITSGQLRTLFNDISAYLLAENPDGATLPSISGGAEFQALLLNSGLTGFNLNHVFRSGFAFNTASDGSANQALLTDGGGTGSWNHVLRSGFSFNVASDGASGQVLSTNGAGVGSFVNNSSVPSPQVISSAPTTVSSNTINLVTVTSGTISLPATPATTDEPIYFLLGDGADWATNNWDLGRNGSNIEGSAADLTINLNNSFMTTYVGATDGWRIITF